MVIEFSDMRVAVIDHGMGNLHSVLKAVIFAASRCSVVADVYFARSSEELLLADKIIFPGQGFAPDCMVGLSEMKDALLFCLSEGRVFLGICVGAQLLLDFSEEGEVETLGLVKGVTRRFTSGKVPHVGWNKVFRVVDHPLMHGVDDGEYFYFLHSYYMSPEFSENVAAITLYSGLEFCSCVFCDNVFATQFHLEKSHNQGVMVLENFLRWDFR